MVGLYVRHTVIFFFFFFHFFAIFRFENLSEEDLSEDDRLLDEQEDFERKYNFRYEEPDSEFVSLW